MTRKEAIEQLQYCKGLIKQNGQVYLDERDFPLLDMAIEALSADTVSREAYHNLVTASNDIDRALREYQDKEENGELLSVVRCKDCEYQNECEEVVLFDISDDEIMGHRVHWCSYGRSENDETRKTRSRY